MYGLAYKASKYSNNFNKNESEHICNMIFDYVERNNIKYFSTFTIYVEVNDLEEECFWIIDSYSKLFEKKIKRIRVLTEECEELVMEEHRTDIPIFKENVKILSGLLMDMPRILGGKKHILEIASFETPEESQKGKKLYI